MSLITRCPACGTMFKVVPDQLRISEGWVRCGHCAEIFDASAHLQSYPLPPPVRTPPAPEPEPQRGPSSDQGLAVDQASYSPPTEDVSSSIPHEDVSSSMPTDWSADQAFPEQAVDSVALLAQASQLVENPLDQPFRLRRQDLPASSEPSLIEPSLIERPAPEPEFTAPIQTSAKARAQIATEPPTEPAEPSFVRQARRQAFWRLPLVRAVLLLVLLALAVLLALQAAVQERDRLAAIDPSLKPWLARLCEPLGCSIAAARQIDAITIDGSAFNKLRGDTYRLQVTLKNQAAIDVALPALELTLTDGQDQTVVRRVILAPELSPATGVIAAGAEWSGAMAVAVSSAGGAGRIAGYRLLAFYP